MEQQEILRSKIIPPIPTHTYMRRSIFVRKMNASEHIKLTLLHSGAGFGKSSGLSSFFNDKRSIYTWYSVTEEDDNILPFITYLIHSIQRVIPNFGYSLKDWENPSMYPKEEDLTRWLALFINELCEIGEPISIIIDDYHIVDHVFHINYMMEKIIEFLPPHTHLVIATRNRPKWFSLNKLKLTSQLSEITEDDFMFTEDEIIVFFEDYFDKQLTVDEAKNIVQMTEGWAIAVNLMAMQMSETEIPFQKAVKPALHELFTYLSEEVLNRMATKEQDWLLAYSIFPVFSEELIRDFHGDDAANNLSAFAGQHMFIQPLSEVGSYRYHALFQKFLESKWLSKDRASFESTHKKAANYYKKRNNSTQAVYHAIKSEDCYFIGEVLSEAGDSLIKSGQFDWLLDTIKDLPNTVRDTYCQLYFYEGEAHRYRAFYEKAFDAYTASIQLAEEENNAYFQSRANAGIAHIYLDTIQPEMAKSYLLEAIVLAQRSKKTSFREMELLKRQFAENLVNLGKAADAQEWVENEKLDTTILREGNLDARMSLRTGKLSTAKETLTNRLIEKSALPDSHRETDVLLSLIYSLMGKVDLAFESAKKGIELGEREKSGFVEAVGWIRMGHVKVLSDPYNLQIPDAYYVKAIDRMEKLNVSRGKAEPLMGLSIIKARQGLFEEAISLGEEGLRETEKVNDGWLSGLIRIGLAIVHFYGGNYKCSKENAIAANILFNKCGDKYGAMVASFWLMNVYNKTEEKSLFSEQSRQFAKLCVTNDYFFFLKIKTIFCPFDMESIPSILIKSRDSNKEDKEIQQIIHEMNLVNVVTHPGYKIEIQMLGIIKVHLGLDEVDERDWQRDKSKELFIYLILNKDRYISKEEIMHTLWEMTDEKKADRDFKVVLNALLKVLEPKRSPREKSFFILRKQAMYRLNPDAVVISDLDRFQRYTEEGLNEPSPMVSSDLLLKAITLYKGQLFEEKLAVGWINEERERIEQKYIIVIERLAQTYTRLSDFGKTIYWAEKLLRIDNTWEEAYRLLMFAHYQQKNRSQAIKWYKKCILVLSEELMIEPMQTTEEMYKIILNEL
ncbi:BTAD domain-containing putative transcriptional regulator [Sporosarcina sp. FA9]|uniref:BTAD domain-containing putative transcriptional regulator n=1 Tax=Sporosarcina sp. FA9 TaxID=3413030 RepID=UPI003F65E6D0